MCVIATTVQTQGARAACYRHVVTTRTCGAIRDAEVVVARCEEELLLKWREFIVQIDPGTPLTLHCACKDVDLVDAVKLARTAAVAMRILRRCTYF